MITGCLRPAPSFRGAVPTFLSVDRKRGKQMEISGSSAIVPGGSGGLGYGTLVRHVCENDHLDRGRTRESACR
ncbi:hypothetical protein SAMN05216266_1489 [Amycolatopsis marina]|uniref:Uncharacterized protein n=1 Tax=Amycolatopsis marina TaxID=490629 RepID=A0A1I1CQ26_9PSEU|nr:hypothetical protein SAMN05216266_1489 [Amycolatopsis marina]